MRNGTMARARSLQGLVSFLSDYGLKDDFVGTCHGVIAARFPAARVIDLTHEIPRHDVLAGAIVLRGSLHYVPAAVHLAVVDPGVGTDSRRAVALRAAEGSLLVGPDNGLLMPAAEALGGVVQAVDVGDTPERLEPVSRTFHGRDIFAPVAAALAAGAALGDVGEPLDERALVSMEMPSARVEEGTLTTHVLLCDGFGNLTLDASPQQLHGLGAQRGGRLAVHSSGGRHLATHAEAFAEVPAGELLLYTDSRGSLALAVNRGSAAELLGAAPGEELSVRAA
jgi:hypothetical protein